MWDPYQYARFSAQRSRPFFDLFAQLKKLNPVRVTDLGCGTGELTRFFARRWPQAVIEGLDRSEEMLAIARNYEVPGHLIFAQGDIETWEPAEPIDLLFSHAVLHWIPDHPALIPKLARSLSPRGTLALQIPNNADEPSHRILGELMTSERWRGPLQGMALNRHVRTASWYAQTLLELGCTADVWESRYIHLLTGERPVLEWLKGTTLRPVLHRLGNETLRQEFLDDLGQALEPAYPAIESGTLFPFKRILIIATREPQGFRVQGAPVP